MLIPYTCEVDVLAILIFPVVGAIADLRREGHVHRALFWGIGTIVASTLFVEILTFSPIGDALYRSVTAGSPGERVAPRAFPPVPASPLRTGRPASI